MKPYFLTFVGIIKFCTLILGGISYGLGVYSYDETIIQEEYFLRSVQICVIISTIYFTIQILSQKLVESTCNKAIDVVWHITGSIALLLESGLVIYSAIDNERQYCEILFISHPEHFCQHYKAKLAAGLITLLNGVLYILVATFVFLENAFEDGTKKNMRSENFKQGQIYLQDQKSRSQPRFTNSSLPKCSYYYGERY